MPGRRGREHGSLTARAIMVLGTASHVGKSLLAAALCRILAADGYRVAPFKAQNMSLNSAATPAGLEIGRAQAMQAEAAGVAPHVDMNPILLKPTSDQSSQVILLGRVHAVERAADYHLRRVEEYWPIVLDAYRRLAEQYDVIVIEGAGSPAEINLKATDIVNMRVALASGARCLLVGDIDRGGVFAALLGTMELLDPAERACIAAFAINKFRGDVSLLTPGVTAIAERIGIPCAGVIPWLPDVGLDEEDSVALDDAPAVAHRQWSAPNGDRSRRLRVAVVALPYLANATDFAALGAEAELDVAFAHTAGDLLHADVVIVPGTKNTLQALRWLRAGGFDAAILHAAREALVLGICGGLQLLGTHIADPHGVEDGGESPGLGLLPLRTTLAREKTTQLVRVQLAAGGWFGMDAPACEGDGYEIHMGESDADAARVPFATLARPNGPTVSDGAVSADRRVAGSYVHGLFADDAMRHAFVRAARHARGLAAPETLAAYGAEREARFDRLAAHVRAALDLTGLLG